MMKIRNCLEKINFKTKNKKTNDNKNKTKENLQNHFLLLLLLSPGGILIVVIITIINTPNYYLRCRVFSICHQSRVIK